MLEKVSKSNKTGTAAKVSEILDSAESEVTKMKKLNSPVPLHLYHERNQLPKCMAVEHTGIIAHLLWKGSPLFSICNKRRSYECTEFSYANAVS